MADIITVNGTRYYNANQLREQDPVYFHGTSRSVRKIIEKKKIPQSEYIYASHSKKKGWTAASDQTNPCPKATLLLSVQWINQNMNQNMDPDDPIEAPAIMMLTDEEKFHDEHGNIVEIETRCERQHDKAYFLVSDVSKVFNMPNISKTIMNKEYKYVQNDDYKTFICNDDATTNAAPTKRLFLTYEGMIKVLYSSRSGNAKAFRSWATKVLFAAQMGTQDSKEQLASTIIQVPPATIKHVVKLTKKGLPYKKPKRRITESVKKTIAGKQNYKCAASIPGYQCPLYRRNGDGIFDESGYEIDHIEEFSINNNESDGNLQALCLMCHMVKTKRFNRSKKQ